MAKGKVKEFFKKITPSRRRIVQVYAALLFNCNMQGFVTGKIFEGATKAVCVPGMNCYSCPGAIGACPLGSLQNALAGAKTKTVTYVLGILLLYAILFGRAICGYLCPAGLLQELLYKIRTPKLKKNKVTRILSYFKYILLAVMVIAIPLAFGLTGSSTPVPAFCKYICPVGTFEGAVGLLSNPNNGDFFEMLGGLFTWKFCLLCAFLVASVFIYRVFCRFFCPLGALYGLFNKIAVLGIHIDESKCNHCGACVSHCKMDVKVVGDHECILCGECKDVCSTHAISYRAQEMIAYFKAKKAAEASTNQKEAALKTEEIEKPAPKKKTGVAKKVFVCSTVSLAVLTLAGASVYAALSGKQSYYALSDTCDDFSFSDVYGNAYNVASDQNAKIIYFFSDTESPYLSRLDSYASNYADKLSVAVISPFEMKDSLKAFVDTAFPDTKIHFASDTLNGDLISKFSESKAYDYSASLDKNNKVIISAEGVISEKTFDDVVWPAMQGKTIGNEVGNICIGQDVQLIYNQEGEWNVSDQKGKACIINFWGTWCGPCLAELPEFQEVYAAHQNAGLEFIAIHQAGFSETEVNSFIAGDSRLNTMTCRFGLDDFSQEYYKALGGKNAWPMTLIVNREGVITAKHQGRVDKATLEDDVIEALG